VKEIFINLKRFDVARSKGGVCPMEDSGEWIEQVIAESVDLNLGSLDGVDVVYFVPEALILPAQKKLIRYPEVRRKNLHIGCQGVFRENIESGKNFGAFTTNLPAASAYQMGCLWTIIGHSEERRDKQEIIGRYQPNWNSNNSDRVQCGAAVNGLVNQEVLTAMKQGMDVLLCVGETAEERGEGSFEEQQSRIGETLYTQLKYCLAGTSDFLPHRKLVLGYEPIWAIGPGKAPPGREYIIFVSEFLKKASEEICGCAIPIVYGGGLKEGNSAMISGIQSIDGGLVALTRFSGEIGFYVKDLKKIITEYLKHAQCAKGENL
jgi:triosephosphate isomerase